MTGKDPMSWLSSMDLVRYLATRRNNDVKVNVGDILVPVESIHYHELADCIVIELVRGDDYRMAMETDPLPGRE